MKISINIILLLICIKISYGQEVASTDDIIDWNQVELILLSEEGDLSGSKKVIDEYYSENLIPKGFSTSSNDPIEKLADIYYDLSDYESALELYRKSKASGAGVMKIKSLLKLDLNDEAFSAMDEMAIVGDYLYLSYLISEDNDYETNKKLLKIFKSSSDLEAKFSLGKMYQKGFGTPKNNVRALSLFEQSSNLVSAKVRLLEMYLFDDQIANKKKARYWFDELTNTTGKWSIDSVKESSYAAYRMGGLLSNGLIYPINYDRAIEYYQKVGNSPYKRHANLNIGLLNHLLAGVQNYRMADVLEYYEKGTNELYFKKYMGVAEYVLGKAYVQGSSSVYVTNKDGFTYERVGLVKKDLEKAVYWFTLGAERGSPLAARELGNLFSQARAIKRDQKKAIEFYKIAALQGDSQSQERLAELAQGWDNKYSYVWHNVCMVRGSKLSRKKLQALKKKLSREEITIAEKMTLAIVKEHPEVLTGSERLLSDNWLIY